MNRPRYRVRVFPLTISTSDREFDRMFVKYMIQRHNGPAIHMTADDNYFIFIQEKAAPRRDL